MKLKHLFFAIALGLLPFATNAQTKKEKATDQEYKFTVVKENPITSIKNQYRSGTCWCFAGISFIESEAIRINNIKDTTKYPDFSEMFIVSHSYQERADKYVRLDGHMNFAAGSECEDVLHVMKKYGLVPNEVMPGLCYGTKLPVHGELDATTKAYVEAIVQNPNKELSTAWKKGFEGIINAYLGECPTQFEYQGKKYTPITYRDSYKLKSEDYISFTSLSHQPFYTKFAIEVCDNWRGDMAYNLPIDEFMDLWFSVVEKGYTTTWGGDVSEAGFTRTGIATYPLIEKKETHGSDQEKWVGKNKEDEKVEIGPKENFVSQEVRQRGFDLKSTTDDHGMHVYGIAKDQYGNRYFIVKNSWGTYGKHKGTWHISEAYSRAKALGFIVHKDALPKQLKEKLGIK